MTAATRSFVDTSVLVYAYDADAGEKHAVARALLARLWESREGTLSTQVLQEFYVTATRKLPRPLEPARARRVVAAYRVWLDELIDVPAIVEASEIAEYHQLSFWDALIVSAAKQAGADRILTEDFQAGRHIEGLLIENPFADISN